MWDRETLGATKIPGFISEQMTDRHSYHGPTLTHLELPQYQVCY